MSIYVNLDEIIKKNNITSKELAELIGITEANLSILRSNKAKAIRFSTLNKLCKILQCEPGDILKYIDDNEEGEESEDE
ncbi:MAG: helix-turn-helix transcriptional regulator [Bacilli bacterium]|nr:helix-turn-helix transcriptional regulator [Bacilli bacterium]